MAHVATQPYFQLLLQFYQTVACRHPKVTENGSQLQSILNSDQTSISKQDSTHQAKKISRATNCSQSSQHDSLQGLGEAWPNDSLQFTFYPIEKYNQDPIRQQIINFRYHSPSIFKVLLYSLCFNHLHFRTVPRQGLLRIYRQDQAIVESLIAILHERVKREERNNGDRQGCSLQTFAHFMSHLSSGVECTVKGLKVMIDGLDDELARQLCIAIAQQTTTQADKSAPSQDGTQNEQDDSDVLEMIASQLSLRIKLKDGRESVSWGRKDSQICIVIMQSTITHNFSLKQVIFYHQRQAKAGHPGQTLKEQCLKAQLAEI